MRSRAHSNTKRRLIAATGVGIAVASPEIDIETASRSAAAAYDGENEPLDKMFDDAIKGAEKLKAIKSSCLTHVDFNFGVTS